MEGAEHTPDGKYTLFAEPRGYIERRPQWQKSRATPESEDGGKRRQT